jgi:hypothetical protein
MPFTVHLAQPLPEGRHFVLFVTSCPIGAKRTRSFTWNARNYQLDPSEDQSFVDFQQTILSRTASWSSHSDRKSCRST